jgi:hypothetical protein
MRAEILDISAALPSGLPELQSLRRVRPARMRTDARSPT